MKNVFLPILSFFVIFSVVAQSGVEQEIVEAIKTETQAYMDCDYDEWSKYWAKKPFIRMQGINSFGHGEVVGWENYKRGVMPYFDAGKPLATNIEKVEFEVNLLDDAVVQVGYTELVITTSGDTAQVNDVDVLMQKNEGHWKYIYMSKIFTKTYENTDAMVELDINMTGYKLLNRNKVDEAIKIFTLNTELFPNSFNVYDSLGEAYMKKGDKENAIKYYKKSIEINPNNKEGKQMLEKLQSD